MNLLYTSYNYLFRTFDLMRDAKDTTVIFPGRSTMVVVR